jgi:hypothetical protein
VIAIVACSKTKLRFSAPARMLYTSRLFKASLDYASVIAMHVYVASALYGLVELDDVIEPYERTLATMDARERQLWGAGVATSLLHGSELAAGDKLCILAGAAYAEPLVTAYRANYQADLVVEEPLAKMQIGERFAWLQYARAYCGLEQEQRGGSR